MNTFITLLNEYEFVLDYFLWSMLTFTTLTQIVLNVWLVLVYMWIYRRGGISALGKFRQIVLKTTGIDEIRNGFITLGVSAFGIGLYLITVAGFVSISISSAIMAMSFTMTAILIRERVDLWPQYRSASFEATLLPYVTCQK